MSLITLIIGITVCSLTFVCAEKNYQKWSEQTEKGDPYDLECDDPFKIVFVNPGDNLVWTKDGYDGDLASDSNYEFLTKDLVLRKVLRIKDVKGESAGVYFCHVNNGTGMVGRIVKGLNLGGPSYSSGIKEYRENIVVGVISGASVFVLIVGVCAVENFRKLPEEQKLKRKERKEERMKKREALKRGNYLAHDNPGMDMAEGDASNGSPYTNNVADTQTSTSTHL